MRNLEQREVQQVAGGNAAADCLGFAASVASVGLAAPGTPANAVAATAAVAAGIGCVGNVSIGPAPASVDSCAVSVSPEGGSVCTTASDAGSASAASAACEGDASACGAGGGGGGGKVICTELCRLGAIDRALWMADIRYSQDHFSARTLRGYHLWGIPFVRLMRRHPVLARLALPPVRWFAEDIGYRMGVRAAPNWKGWLLREFGFRPVCSVLGLFARARDWRALWPDDRLADARD